MTDVADESPSGIDGIAGEKLAGRRVGGFARMLGRAMTEDAA